MIFDRLENMPMYFAANAELKKVYDFLKGLDAADCRPGRHGIGDDGMYANVDRYKTQPAEGRKAEAHRRFIDVQYVLSGKEKIGYASVGALKEYGRFDEDKDIGFYDGECQGWLSMLSGDFAVIFPHEGHLPCTVLEEPCEVVKVVVKVPVK